MLSRIGLSCARACSNASSPQGYQSTGLSACWSRYGLVSFAKRFAIMRSFLPCLTPEKQTPGAACPTTMFAESQNRRDALSIPPSAAPCASEPGALALKLRVERDLCALEKLRHRATLLGCFRLLHERLAVDAGHPCPRLQINARDLEAALHP